MIIPCFSYLIYRKFFKQTKIERDCALSSFGKYRKIRTQPRQENYSKFRQLTEKIMRYIPLPKILKEKLKDLTSRLNVGGGRLSSNSYEEDFDFNVKSRIVPSRSLSSHRMLLRTEEDIQDSFCRGQIYSKLYNVCK